MGLTPINHLNSFEKEENKTATETVLEQDVGAPNLLTFAETGVQSPPIVLNNQQSSFYIDVDSLIGNSTEEEMFIPEKLHRLISEGAWLNNISLYVENLPSKCFVEYIGPNGLSPVQLAIMIKSESAALMIDKYCEDRENTFEHVRQCMADLLQYSNNFGNIHISALILRKQSQFYNKYFKDFNFEAFDALYVAVSSDNQFTLNKVLENETSLLCIQFIYTDLNRDTPLHLAVRKMNLDLVQRLVDSPAFELSRAEIFISSDGFTPKQLAMQMRNEGIVNILCNLIKIDNFPAQINFLFDAIQYGSLQTVYTILSSISDYIDFKQWFMENENRMSLLYTALSLHRLDAAALIINKMMNGKQIYCNIITSAIRTSNIEIVKSVFDGYKKALMQDPFSFLCYGLHPLIYAIKHQEIELAKYFIEEIDKSGGNCYNIKGKGGNTTLHYIAQYGNIEIARIIWPKICSDIVDDVNPPNKVLKTPLHFAALEGHADILDLIYSYMPNAIGFQINPSSFGSTPLHKAAVKGHIKAFRSIMKHIPKAQIAECLNHKDGFYATVLYKAVSSSSLEIVQEILQYDGVHLNGIGPKGLLSFFNGAKRVTSLRYLIGKNLRERGCLEYRFQNGREGRVFQGRQSIHATMATATIKQSLDKLKAGVQPEDIEDSFRNFTEYCNLNNPDFMNELRSIDINHSSFSRNLIVQALSSVSAGKAAVIFANAIDVKLAQMATASTYWPEFKERCGLIWFLINDPIEQTKFYDLRVSSNPELHNQVVGKLRKKFLVQLIETRFEYQENVRENEADIDDIEEPDELDDSVDINEKDKMLYNTPYLKALFKSREACPGGTCNYMIDCFNFMHPDIKVLEADLPPVYEASSGLKDTIGNHLHTLIINAFISSPEIFEDLLDKFLGVSDEVFTENDVKQYVSNIRNKNNVPLIGRFLGVMKATMLSNSIILEAIGRFKSDFLSALVNLEDVLSAIYAGLLSSALMEGFKESYRNKVRLGKISLESIETLNDYSLRAKLQEAFQSINLLEEKWFQEIISFDLKVRISKYLNSQLNVLAFPLSQNHSISDNKVNFLKFSPTEVGHNSKKQADAPAPDNRKIKKIRFLN